VNEYAKLIWNKHTSGQVLSDQEVTDGRQIFKDLAQDLGELFGWEQAAKECKRLHKYLVDTASERGID
jgi:hypothetical protein